MDSQVVCGLLQGILTDGTDIAVKQLSSQSRQGNREFLNEVGVISCLQHPNLVKLHGCCIDGDQLMLVYEYMENNSLSNALFGECSVVYTLVKKIIDLWDQNNLNIELKI